MARAQRTVCIVFALGFLSILSACGGDKENEETVLAVDVAETSNSDKNTNPSKMSEGEAALAAVLGATEIPYPVYPNGTKYRVGGENGLKIVVFQTSDAFHKVDSYYSDLSDNAGMSRLMAMSDYVRYTQENDDLDPWATHRPGIVIHQFNDEKERKMVGANAQAKTNIIMSF